jgi:Ran GTPase-activating protein (RanGAP) involved in mRNA processing and transport
VVDVLKYLKPIKRIKGLKLVKNNLTSEGLARIIELIPAVTNLNLSFNTLGDESLGVILSSRLQVPQLRIINISNNKIN